jgi:hypothetical protein
MVRAVMASPSALRWYNWITMTKDITLTPPADEWSDEEVLAAAAATMSPVEDRKLGQLLDRQCAGTLTPDDRDALRDLMQVYQEGLLHKAQGLREAVRRGLRPNLLP